MTKSAGALAHSGSQLRPWHEQLADYMLLNPRVSNIELASYFAKTPSWVSSVVNSDMFRTYYARRRREVHEQVKDRLMALAEDLAERGLVELQTRMKSDPDRTVMKIGELEKITRLGLEAGGFVQKGEANGNNPAVVVTVNLAREALEKAREVYRKQQGVEDAQEVGENGAAGAADKGAVGRLSEA